MSARRRVAITGIGLVTPVGNDVATTWQALLTGAAGGREITLFDASGFPVHIAAEVKDFDDAIVGDRKQAKFTMRSHRFASPPRSRRSRMRASGRRPRRPRAGDARWAPG